MLLFVHFSWFEGIAKIKRLGLLAPIELRLCYKEAVLTVTSFFQDVSELYLELTPDLPSPRGLPFLVTLLHLCSMYQRRGKLWADWFLDWLYPILVFSFKLGTFILSKARKLGTNSEKSGARGLSCALLAWMSSKHIAREAWMSLGASAQCLRLSRVTGESWPAAGELANEFVVWMVGGLGLEGTFGSDP